MSIFPNLVAGVVNSSGVSQTGMLAYFYEPGSGSTTLKRIYTDDTLLVPATNPYPLDDGGRTILYGTGSYRIRVTDSTGNITIQDIPVYDAGSTYADQVILRNAAGFVGTGDFYTGTTVDAALQAIKNSTGAKDAKYRHDAAASTVAAVTLQAKLSRIYDVLDFGATGTGTSDDSSYIQAAINACVADGGGTVWFKAGTYRCDSGLTIAACTGVTFAGDGGAIVKQYAAVAPAAFTLFAPVAAARVTFRDLIFYGYGNAASTASIAIAIPAGNALSRVESCQFTGAANGQGFNVGVKVAGDYTHIRNCQFDRIYSTSVGCGVNLAAATFTRVQECVFLMYDGAARAASGILASAGVSGGIHILDCTVTGANSYGIDIGPASATVNTTDSRVSGCYLFGNQGGGIRATECDDTTIIGNHLDGNIADSIFCGSSGANTGGAQRLHIIGNRIVGTSASASGIVVSGVDAAAATDASRLLAHPTMCRISDNILESCGTYGIQLIAADDCMVDGNLIRGCSLGSTGVRPAIFVSTSSATANVCGGQRNSIIGNQVADVTGASHINPLYLADSAGGTTNLRDTYVLGNAFNKNVTPFNMIRYGATTSDLRAQWARSNLLGTRGMVPAERTPIQTATLSFAITGEASGLTYVADVATAAAAITLTLPALDLEITNDGWYVDVVRYNIVITFALIVAVSGAGYVIVNPSAGTAVAANATTTVVGASSRFTFRLRSGVGLWFMTQTVGTWT